MNTKKDLYKGVIVAAGHGSRLKAVTKKPKSLLEFDGKPILQRSIEALRSVGIEECYVVGGFALSSLQPLSQELQIHLVANPFFEHSNNMASLWLMKSYLKNSNFVHLHGDLIFDSQIFTDGFHKFCHGNFQLDLVSDYGETDEEAMKVQTDKKGLLIDCGKHLDPKKASAEWIGMTFVSKTASEKLFSTMESLLLGGNLQAYDSAAFLKLARANTVVGCSNLGNRNWVEIDDPDDYTRAKLLFDRSA